MKITGADMYLITLYFDEKTNKMLEKQIRNLSDATGNTFMIEHKVPPHLTVSAIEARAVGEILPAFLSLKGKLTGETISVVSVGQLLPHVLYTAPVLDEYLWKLSEEVYHAVKDIPNTSVSRFYQLGSWLPHITLAKTLTKEQMQRAFCLMQNQFVPFEAKVTEIGLAKVNPHEDVERFGI